MVKNVMRRMRIDAHAAQPNLNQSGSHHEGLIGLCLESSMLVHTPTFLTLVKPQAPQRVLDTGYSPLSYMSYTRC